MSVAAESPEAQACRQAILAHGKQARAAFPAECQRDRGLGLRMRLSVGTGGALCVCGVLKVYEVP